MQRYIEKIKRVQRRATRIPTGFEKFDYEARLKRLSLTTLQDRRIRGDLDISGPAVSVSGNILSMRRESF